MRSSPYAVPSEGDASARLAEDSSLASSSAAGAELPAPPNDVASCSASAEERAEERADVRLAAGESEKPPPSGVRFAQAPTRTRSEPARRARTLGMITSAA